MGNISAYTEFLLIRGLLKVSTGTDTSCFLPYISFSPGRAMAYNVPILPDVSGPFLLKLNHMAEMKFSPE